MKPTSSVSDNLQYLFDLHSDEDWRKHNEPRLVEAIGVALNVINKLSEDTGNLLAHFYEYVNKVSLSPLVSIGSNSDVYNGPTQTSGNRATRRARVREK